MTLPTVAHDTFVVERTYDVRSIKSSEPGPIPCSRPAGSPAPLKLWD